MAEHKNPLYPSIIVPLDGIIEQTTEMSLCDGVVLRNLDSSELDRVNQLLFKGPGHFWGIQPFPPEIVCVESRLRQSQTEKTGASLESHHEQIRREGGLVLARVTSLLRLAQAGPIGARLIIVPLAETIPSAYTLAQIEYLPAIIRPKYPPAYKLTASIITKLQELFQKFWKVDLEGTPGIRWLNKANSELNADDAVAHLVFGLEQLLLRGENERAYLSFKLALRGAWLLGAKDGSREEAFAQLREGYKLRNKIAHGGLKRELNDQELMLSVALENMLRQLVLMFLSQPEKFEQAALQRMVLGLEEEILVKC